MQIYTSSMILLTLAAQVLASPSGDFVNGGRRDQVPMENHLQPMMSHEKPCTMTRTTTRTHYEINVVSTVYRVRSHPHDAEPTRHPALEAAEQTLVFGVEGTGCDRKACTICRMLNNCSDDEANCTGCDLAYYCNQCPPSTKPSLEDAGKHVKKTCSLGQGRTIPCDETDEAIEERHEVFHFGG